jgi:lipoprotein NlpI
VAGGGFFSLPTLDPTYVTLPHLRDCRLRPTPSRIRFTRTVVSNRGGPPMNAYRLSVVLLLAASVACNRNRQGPTEGIGGEPKDAQTYFDRGVARLKKKDLDAAIKDFTEVIRLDPQSANAFYNRGNAHGGKKEYDKAIEDYSGVIRLDPKNAYAHANRAMMQLALRQPESVKSFQFVLDLEGGKGTYSPYAMVLGHLAARRHNDATAAKRFLGESAAKLGEDWPYPAVRFLRGDIDEAALLDAATDDGKQTEARCYLCLDHLLKGRTDEAVAHFRWVKEHGNTTYVEYAIVAAELERLEKAKK